MFTSFKLLWWHFSFLFVEKISAVFKPFTSVATTVSFFGTTIGGAIFLNFLILQIAFTTPLFWHLISDVTQETLSNISTNLGICFWPVNEFEPNMHSHFLLCFGLYHPPEGNMWLFSCEMLHYVHQLLANFVYVSLGAGKILSGFRFSTTMMRAVGVKQNGNVAGN